MEKKAFSVVVSVFLMSRNLIRAGRFLEVVDGEPFWAVGSDVLGSEVGKALLVVSTAISMSRTLIKAAGFMEADNDKTSSDVDSEESEW